MRAIDRFAFEGQVGQDVLHGGLVDEELSKARRWAAWWTACASGRRMRAAEPMTQSSRVWATISMIVGTPRPSSPMSWAHVSRYSISLEAFDRLPSLSLSRWMAIGFCVPSGLNRGTRKHDRPRSVCASVRKASFMMAEQNHLCPVSRYSPPEPPRPIE